MFDWYLESRYEEATPAADQYSGRVYLRKAVPDNIVNRDMVWKLGKLQSDYNELRFDVGTVLTVHKSFVFRLLIFKQHG